MKGESKKCQAKKRRILRTLQKRRKILLKCFFSSTLAVLASLSAHVAHAQSVWQNPVNGNWDVASNWSSLPVSSNTTQVVFNATGAESYATTNNIGPLILNRITVNNTGTGTVTIAGSATNTFTLAGADPQLDITGNALFSGLFAGAGTMRKTGTGTFIHNSNNSGFTGTLVIDQGTFVNSSTGIATTNFNPVSIVVNNGGTYQFGASTVGDPNLPNSTYITVNSGGTVNWQEGETFGGVNLNGGVVNLQQGSMTMSGATAQNWTNGSLIGGNFTVGGNTAINKTTAGTVTLGGNVSITTGTGRLNILDGTLSMLGASNLGTAAVRLGASDGTTAGTFDYQGTTATRAGAFTLQAGGGAIHVAKSGTELTLSGAFDGAGGLAKNGVGTLALTGGLSNTGLINIEQGTLVLAPTASNGGTIATAAAGGFTVGNDATLSIASGAGTGSLTVQSLNLSAPASTLQFGLDAAILPTTPLLVVAASDGLAAGGTLRVSNTQPMSLGSFTLIDYNGGAINSGFNLQLQGRTAGSLIYDTTNTRIDLNVTALSENVKWSGATNANWDVGTAANIGGTNNWRLETSLAATNFIQTDSVVFDDSASGNFAVNLQGAVAPSSVVVNNSSNNYTFQGTGSIAGSGTLTKSGTGTLVVATDNSQSGSVTLAGGTLQIGAGGTTGSLTNSSLNMSAGTTLAFDRTNEVSFAAPIALDGDATIRNNNSGVASLSGTVGLGANTLNLDGSGNLVFGATVSGTNTINKNGTGTVSFQGNSNSFTGTLNVNAGRFILQDVAGGDLGASGIVINNGGTFQFGVSATDNPDHPDSTFFTVNDGGTLDMRIGEQIGGVNLNGGTILFDGLGTNPGNINTNAAGTQSFTSGLLNGVGANQSTFGGVRVIEKTTSGTVTVQGNIALTSVTNILDGTVVLAGTQNLGNSAINLGGTSTTGTLEYGGGTASRSAAMTLNDGGGVVRVSNASSNLTLSGVVSGNGGLAKQGSGALTLSGNNTYTGATSVQSGSLIINGNQSTATGNLTVASGASLGGSGTIGGSTTISGSHTPGNSPGTQTFLAGLTYNTGADLSWELVANSNTGSGTNFDVINVTGGTLVINTGVTSNLVFNGTGSTVQWADAFWDTDRQWLVYANSAAPSLATNSVFGSINVSADSGNNSLASIRSAAGFSWGTVGNDIVLNYSAVPEPSSMILLGLAGGIGIGLRRRMKK
ncbi:Extracellular serine protease precursor [Pirellula sp. SH-Sr6A]|uniref:beta strand repeat-containing protein n=1 Tax=Pirellula sp. SH-Sr6A TaxID=1632865 RepID=UPI00078D9AE5|nr:autotransporter-associated beta strand repeat-containing protein [Pirellula sp. SH-Sr6A]AMV33688.1 Extracellular serine protease precursor [Pirellula sp. SH-Sr6A]